MLAAGEGKAKKGKQPAAPGGNMHVQLYNLKSDPHETKDVSADHPDIIAQIEKLMRQQHVPSENFPFAAID